VVSSERRFSACFWLAALHIIPREERTATARRASLRSGGRSARPEEGVVGLAIEEVGVDRAGKDGSSSLTERYSVFSFKVRRHAAPISVLCGAPHNAEIGAA
jgi:hypothetical protein